MSRQAAAGSTVGAGKGVLAALVVVGTALALLLIVRARPAPDPFDPRSSAANGATALVALLERSGSDVTITRTAPDPGAETRLLVIDDRLDDVQRSATLDFVENGGVAIVADPASALHGGPEIDGGSVAIEAFGLPTRRLDADRETNVPLGICTVGALKQLRGLYVPEGLLFPVGLDEPQCFSDDGQSFVIVRQIGRGTVVGLGDNEVLVNQHLRRADNAGLATALVAPRDGQAVTILLGTGTAASIEDVGEGDDTLVDLVPPWVWMTLVLAALGFVIFAASRSVRVGAVLDEPLATPLAGSELVAATGNLMHRAKHTSRAGWLMQNRLHRDLCTELHVDLAAPLADLDAAVAARSELPPGTTEQLLSRTTSDDSQLLALSGQIDRIRKDVLT
jgi:hypothetical protein